MRPLNALDADVLKALDISALASTASNSKATQLHGIAHLLRQLGTPDRTAGRPQYLPPGIGSQRCPTRQLQSVAELLRELGNRRVEMLEDLNITKLASTASDAQPGQLKGVAELLRELGNRRVEMLEDLNITKLASTASKAILPNLVSWPNL